MYKLGAFGNTGHLAATLKKLITILLLFLLAGQTSGTFNAASYEMNFMMKADEGSEKCNEEKFEKEFIEHTSADRSEFSSGITFIVPGRQEILFPVMDRHTPPPDARL